jgi:hypothetical protein
MLLRGTTGVFDQSADWLIISFFSVAGALYVDGAGARFGG